MREWKVTYWTKEDNPAIPDIETLRFKPENAVVDALTFTPQDSSSLDGVIVPAKLSNSQSHVCDLSTCGVDKKELKK